MDQSSFAAPHGFSQRITSFFACACQGIHQMPLRHFIVLIANAHHLLDLVSSSLSLALEGRPNLAIRTNLNLPNPDPEPWLPFTTRAIHDAIDVFDPVPQKDVTPSDIRAGSLRPASRDQIRDRAVRQRSSAIHQRCPSGTRPSRHQQQTTRVTGFLPPLAPLRFRSARPSTISAGPASDMGQNLAVKPKPGSLQINLLFTIFAKQAQTLQSDVQTFIPSKDIDPSSRHQKRIGGAERDRTADPLLAKQVLSQLSYSPNHRNTCQPPFQKTPPGGSRSNTPPALRSANGGPGKT